MISSEKESGMYRFLDSSGCYPKTNAWQVRHWRSLVAGTAHYFCRIFCGLGPVGPPGFGCGTIQLRAACGYIP